MFFVCFFEVVLILSDCPTSQGVWVTSYSGKIQVKYLKKHYSGPVCYYPNISMIDNIIVNHRNFGLSHVPHRHPTYVGALDFELWPYFVEIIFFGKFSLLTLIKNTTSKQYKYKILKTPQFYFLYKKRFNLIYLNHLSIKFKLCRSFSQHFPIFWA